MNPNEASKSCKCGHHKIKPLAVILFALSWLLATTGVFSWNTLNIIWPILLIVVMIPKLANCKCC